MATVLENWEDCSNFVVDLNHYAMNRLLKYLFFLLVAGFSASVSYAENPLQTPCTGKIDRLNVYSPQANTTFTVDVWMPGDYESQATNRYPVIYINDGQSQFDASISWNNQSWDIDDMITRLHKEGITENAVVVGIHSGPNRFGDYSPSKALTAVSGLKEKMERYLNMTVKGDEYLSFIVNTLKPMIEAKYRVRTDLRSTSIMGSSMGGLISAYAICEYPEVFGNAGCLSTHWIGTLDSSVTPEYPEAVMAYLEKNLPSPENHRLYFDHGTLDLDSYYEVWNNKALEIARGKGYTDDYNLMSYIDVGATHNESCWRNRLNLPLEFILGANLPQMYPEAMNNGLPYSIGQGVILHCFCWKLNDIKNELPRIAAAGFKAVQTSPMERAVKNGDVWYDVYRPYDYTFIDNGMGTREDMVALCDEAARYGIKIIVDIVSNHGTGPEEEHDSWWDENGRMKWDGNIDWSSRWSETHDCLGGYGESNSDDPDVQARTRNYILELKGLGVSGLRWDTAKHIGLPSEGCDFWPSVLDVPGIWSYGEILGTPAEDPPKLKEYADMMWITNTNSGLYYDFGVEWMGITPDRLLHWVESHDTFSNAPYTTQSLTQEEIDQRWAITAARRSATALYFSRPAKGESRSILVGNKGGMDFLRPSVVAANHFHNAMASSPESYYEADGVKAIFRQKGVVIVKPGGGEVVLPVSNLNNALTFEDEVTGEPFRIENDKIIGTVSPETGVAVVYDYKNDRLPAASVIMDPEIKSFNGETCSITLLAVNSSRATYSVDGAAPVEFTSKTTFTIGENVDPGSDIEISWTAETSDAKQVEGSFVVRKNKGSGPAYVYLYFDDADYANYQWYSFVYNMTGNNNGGWPGAPMSINPSLTVNNISGNWYEYKVDTDLAEVGYAMVSSTNAGYRYPGPDVPGIPMEGESIVFTHINGVWSAGRVEDLSGIHGMSADGISLPLCFATVGGVKMNYPETEIYDMTGSMIKRVEQPATVELPRGVYVLRHKTITGKVVVR